MRPLLTVSGLAKQLNLAVRTIHRLHANKRIPKPLRIGGSIRWNPDTIEAWINKGCPKPKD